MKNERAESGQRTRGPSSIWCVLLKVVSSIFWAVVLGVCINSYWWYTRGFEQVITELNSTYQSQLSGLAYRNASLISLVDAGSQSVNDKVAKWTEVARSELSHVPVFQSMRHNHQVTSYFSQPISLATKIYCLVQKTLLVALAKILSIATSIWVLIFAAIFGASDGLRSRYIRTMEGGRESTFIFHRVSSALIQAPIAVLFLYLLLPITLNPEIVVIGISLLFFACFYLTTANLKKFL